MAEVIKVPNIREGYAKIVRMVAEGDKVAPRGKQTREIRDLVIETWAVNALPTGTGRKINPAIGAMEALQLIGGFSDPDLVLKVSKNFSDFMDHGEFHGAYGVRVGDQMAQVAAKLRNDPDSRQAVVTLWDPALDNLAEFHDYPCTVALTFTIRDELLNCSTLMRSNDVWLGLAYDAFQFTQLQWTIANFLGIKAGRYTHHAVSMHIYEKDLSKVFALHAPPAEPQEFQPLGIQASAILEAKAISRLLSRGEPFALDSPSHQWYFNTMQKVHLEAE